MPDLPFDTQDPAVRDFLMLTRLQVLTPLSLLINIAAVGVYSFAISPGLGRIAEMYPTSLTPSPFLIATYVAGIYIMQVGYCAILVLARKTETKQALIKGTGISLVLANWVMAIIAITWQLKAWIASAVFLGVLVILLLYSNIVLNVYHPMATARPLDTAFIHAPIRLFLNLPLTLLLPVSIFIAVGHYWEEGDTKAFNNYAWEGFGVFFVLNTLSAIWIALRRDVVWTVGASWLAISIWQETPKSAPVSISAVIFTFLHPIVLLISFTTLWFHRRRKIGRGAIALPDDEGEAGSANEGARTGTNDRQEGGSRRGVSRVWG